MRFFQEDKDIFNILSEAISEGILVVDEHQNIVATNSPMEQMFGYEKDELKGQNLNILIPQNYHQKHVGHYDGYFAESSQRKMAEGRKLSGVKKNGEEFYVEIGLNPFHIYDKVYIMAIVMDVTKRIESENVIRELNEHLEDKIKQRTKALRDSVAQLTKEVRLRIEAESQAKIALQKEKELNELKTKFLSMVSHEFKTPLSSILTSSMLLGKYTEGEQQPKRDKHINTIKGTVRNLNGILNDFLSIERIDSGKIDYKFAKFNLSKVFNEILYDANMTLKSGQKIQFPDDIDEYVIAQDEKIFKLILSNIIGNAIKYSPENSTIFIEVAFKENNNFLFTVRDEGIGIPKEDQKHIFSRYFRAQNALITQGTGIGLNIVKSHVEDLGGTISFESELEKGSVFKIELPNKTKS
ncbi:PAS domain-containing sensor histidine kinase [Zhouia amylolytica]|uniref:PAS domain-containing sensor histidine kinase n=1 Tax=Zhouia amylolytica TaxID=376730 RepID=UPI0020CBA2F2|nr:PAS domain-containing sensor histidine kinase [Zhouia amylolytica]MCQ0110512.1 PAS domain S-box protein [Zhouia amylolytica]